MVAVERLPSEACPQPVPMILRKIEQEFRGSALHLPRATDARFRLATPPACGVLGQPIARIWGCGPGILNLSNAGWTRGNRA